MEKERIVMKNVVLKGDFDEKFIDLVLSHSNEFYYDFANKLRQPHVTIFISSGGGVSAAAQILVSLINAEPERFRVIAVDHIQSAAFRFFFEVECDKCILKDCIGMYHMSRQEMDMGFDGQPFFQLDKFLLKNYPDFMKEDLQWCESIGMNAQEIEQIAKGDNVYFSPEQLRNFINIQKDDRLQRLEKEQVNTETGVSNGESESTIGVVRSADGVATGIATGRIREDNGRSEVHS